MSGGAKALAVKIFEKNKEGILMTPATLPRRGGK